MIPCSHELRYIIAPYRWVEGTRKIKTGRRFKLSGRFLPASKFKGRKQGWPVGNDCRSLANVIFCVDGVSSRVNCLRFDVMLFCSMSAFAERKAISREDQLLHRAWPGFTLVQPLHNRAWTIENEAAAANMRHHSSFGFLPKPLQAGPTFRIPDNLQKAWTRHPLSHYGGHGWSACLDRLWVCRFRCTGLHQWFGCIHTLTEC